ncbi:unnamed protein product [Paramecium octaurelia]|uniref:Uncharacterized protein n=1 Tax=Paramecium octaurelia TaxID=43137 RepID=A0A8S1YRL7_PAROT|nr:unnamed protein product [Paramecium octaurelia]
MEQKKAKGTLRQISNQQKSKIQIKQKKLNEQIAQISTNYYQQNKTTIQQLSYEELLQVINDFAQKDKETVTTDENMITKDVENKLEKIKQDFQLDIQKSINVLNDQSTDSQILVIKEQLQKIQANSNVQLEQQIRIQELDELIRSSTQLYCQMELLNQTKNQFQQHVKKLNSIKDQIASFSNHQNLTFINQELENYLDKFQKDFQNLKKYCEMDQFNESIQLKDDYIVNKWKVQLESKRIRSRRFNNSYRTRRRFISD